jgi:putative radical SAM enzyme (TIGR03279 family)
VSGARIAGISATSPVLGLDVEVGDVIVAINGREPTDIIEYQQFVDGARVELLLQREGRPLAHKVVIEKEEGQSLGLSIDSAVFDRIRTCDNHCSFCFIYQLPKGMRRSLYVKDDDFRLSFLYGNYTTLTRFTEFDLERVIDERLSPLYVSVHTTNPELRAEMLRNPRGATSLRWLRALLDANIAVHAQVVVCPGVNDGDELARTLTDLVSDYPTLESVAVVPVGVSAFNAEKSMRPHTAAEALDVVNLVTGLQDFCREVLGRTFLYASDEFYLVAGASVPPVSAYDSLDEAENGVGMVSSFLQSFTERTAMTSLGSGFFQSVDGAPAWGYRAQRAEPGHASDTTSIALLTGAYAGPILRATLDDNGFEDVGVVVVENRFFGGNIKVAGLLTGSDINEALRHIDEDVTILLPDVCLNEGRFLDGLTLDDLHRSVVVVPTTGVALREILEQSRTKVNV